MGLNAVGVPLTPVVGQRAAVPKRYTIDGRTPADDEGNCRLFFDLNVPPRLVRVPKSGTASAGTGLRVVEDGHPRHVASLMPGSVACVAVNAGQL